VCGWQAIYGLIMGLVGRLFMIYMGAYEVGDKWDNRWCGRKVIYGLIDGLVGMRYMG